MVIDDDPIVVKYLVTLFQDNGYETCEAFNGLEGTEVMHKEHPDLITLDLKMPEEWGARFFRKLTKDEQFKGTPIIVISGLAWPELAIDKAVATLRKPFDPDEVIKIVKNTIG